MKMRIQQAVVFVAFAVGGITLAAEINDIALSLRQRGDRGEVVLDILVSNVSTGSVEIVSEGITPPWSIWAWFKWEVDGKRVEYPENVAGIPNVKESWRIPKGGVVLWASIPLRSLGHVIKNNQGQNEWRSVIRDRNRHSITILPGPQWKQHKLSILQAVSNVPREHPKELRISSGSIEIGQEHTEQPIAGNGKPEPQP